MTIAPTITPRGYPFQNASNSASLTESLTESKSIQIDNGTDVTLANVSAKYWEPIQQNTLPDPSRVIFDYQKESNKPTYSVLLADLFPFLKTNQLPLFMMSEQVSIHLTFQERRSNNESDRICHSSTGALAKDVALVRGDCQMIADYIFYPQDLMEQYRQANANMSFSYVDYQFVKRTVSIAEYSAGLIQNIGGAGRIVNKVFVAAQGTAQRQDSLLNKYVADGPGITGTTTGKVTTNLKYNDNFLYPIDVSNDARHYHNVFQSEGRVPYISRDLYRGEGQLTIDNTNKDKPGASFEGYPATDTLRQKFFYTAYRLNKGERVNSRGIELYDTRTTLTQATTLRVWLQVMRVASLRDGMFSMAYA